MLRIRDRHFTPEVMRGFWNLMKQSVYEVTVTEHVGAEVKAETGSRLRRAFTLQAAQ